MRISIFGLGYVGCVSAACMAKDGHTVIGVDVNPLKVDLISQGRSPIIEAGLDDLLAEQVARGRLSATTDGHQAVLDTDISLLCVGTPSRPNGNLNTDYLRNVSVEIGHALHEKSGYHTVVVRSTVLPGTVEGILIPVLEEHSGKKAGVDFGVSMNPEFLREGSAIADYYEPSFIVIGELNERSGEAVEAIYEAVDAEVIRVSVQTAEMMKYANNAFHAMKIAFANEIGNVCKAHGIDGQEVMNILVQDYRLNISPAYLKPGFAFGGSCLPKDMRALLYRSKERDLETPVLAAILQSNQRQIQLGIEMVERAGTKDVGVLGLSFKAGTDDLRESSVVPLVETLVGRGYRVSVFDDVVDLSKLIGANKSYIETELPHIASLMRSSIDDVLETSGVVVLANSSPAFRSVRNRMRDGQVLVDLVGLAKNGNGSRGVYEGICW